MEHAPEKIVLDARGLFDRFYDRMSAHTDTVVVVMNEELSSEIFHIALDNALDLVKSGRIRRANHIHRIAERQRIRISSLESVIQGTCSDIVSEIQRYFDERILGCGIIYEHIETRSYMVHLRLR